MIGWAEKHKITLIHIPAGQTHAGTGHVESFMDACGMNA